MKIKLLEAKQTAITEIEEKLVQVLVQIHGKMHAYSGAAASNAFKCMNIYLKAYNFQSRGKRVGIRRIESKG